MFSVIIMLELYFESLSDKNIDDSITSNREKFIELSKYSHVFSEELSPIYNLIELIFTKELSNEILSKKYNNGISYSVLASRQRMNKRYIESLFFAQTATLMSVKFLRQQNKKS